MRPFNCMRTGVLDRHRNPTDLLSVPITADLTIYKPTHFISCTAATMQRPPDGPLADLFDVVDLYAYAYDQKELRKCRQRCKYHDHACAGPILQYKNLDCNVARYLVVVRQSPFLSFHLSAHPSQCSGKHPGDHHQPDETFVFISPPIDPSDRRKIIEYVKENKIEIPKRSKKQPKRASKSKPKKQPKKPNALISVRPSRVSAFVLTLTDTPPV